MRSHRYLSALRALAVFALCAVAFAVLVGCASPAGKAPGKSAQTTATSSADASSAAGKDRPAPAVAPPAPVLSTPQKAVLSYLDWITFAYRILDSDVASKTFSPYEEVRVNSYVMYNVEKRRAIDQQLVHFDVKKVTTKGSTATVDAKETWIYRYIDIDTGYYKGPQRNAIYTTKYTVVKQPGNKGWIVDSVDAESIGPAPE